MKRLNDYRMKLMFVGFVTAVVLSVESAQADFTFGELTNLGPIINSSRADGSPSFSADGLEMYFDSERSGDYDLWVTKRASTDDEWGTPERLGPPVNSSALDGTPCISANGLTLYFNSERSGGFGHYDLWVTTRQTKNDPWGEPVNLGPTVNSTTYDFSPEISLDGQLLYFESIRPGGHGSYDIWVTTRKTSERNPEGHWDTPINLGPPINGAFRDQGPFISSDGLLLLLSTDRPGGYGSWDLWMTRRTTTSDAWAEPVNLGPKINTSYLDGWPCLFPDGSTLYISSQRSGGYGADDIWQASITPIVDLNRDGIIDAADMCIMVDYWGTDNSLCDIGPMPWGDGIVDVQDLIVLAEHFFEDARLVAKWALDETEGDIAYDSIGDNHGTLNGNPTWQPTGGRYAGALEFDGFDDYVSTPFILNPAIGSFSAFAWIKGGAPGDVIITQAGSNGETWLRTNPLDGKLMTGLGDTYFDVLESESIIVDGQWHHIGLAYDMDVLHRRLYVDGAQVAEDATFVAPQLSNDGLYIGVGKELDAISFFSGLIDNVRIYNRVVSP